MTTYEDVKAAYERVGRMIEATRRASEQPSTQAMADAEFNLLAACDSLRSKAKKWVGPQ